MPDLPSAALIADLRAAALQPAHRASTALLEAAAGKIEALETQIAELTDDKKFALDAAGARLLAIHKRDAFIHDLEQRLDAATKAASHLPDSKPE